MGIDLGFKSEIPKTGLLGSILGRSDILDRIANEAQKFSVEEGLAALFSAERSEDGELSLTFHPAE